MSHEVSLGCWACLAAALLAWVGCEAGDEDPDPAGGAGEAGFEPVGGGGSGGSSTTTSTAGGGVGGAGGAGAGGEAPQPCTPPGESAAAVPTPGQCVNGAAVTCSGETATLLTTACGPDEQCHEYPVQEHTFDSIQATGWDLTREFTWAGCVPVDAAPCERSFNGHYWDWPDYAPQCGGDAKTYCAMPALPEYELVGAQTVVGTEAGYVFAEPCPAGDTCREPLGGPSGGFSSLACIPIDAPVCSSFAEACAGEVLHYCDLTYGYERDYDCAQNGDLCRPGCDGVDMSCVEGGSQSCDPNSHPQVCSTPLSYTACPDCNTSEVDCSWVVVCDWNDCYSIPGRCEVLQGQPTCIDASAVLCDPDAAETCNGSVAQTCPYGILHARDCASDGLACFVGQGDRAGCAPADSQPCTIGDPYQCEGSLLVGCCPASGDFYSFGDQPPCPPGYLSEIDCSTLPPGQTCFDWGGFAECNL